MEQSLLWHQLLSDERRLAIHQKIIKDCAPNSACIAILSTNETTKRAQNPEFRALDPSLKIEVCISNNNMEFDLTIKDNTSDID